MGNLYISPGLYKNSYSCEVNNEQMPTLCVLPANKTSYTLILTSEHFKYADLWGFDKITNCLQSYSITSICIMCIKEIDWWINCNPEFVRVAYFPGYLVFNIIITCK